MNIGMRKEAIATGCTVGSETRWDVGGLGGRRIAPVDIRDVT
jgi:hypothetical protein